MMIELQKSHEKKYVVFSTLFSGQWRKRRYLTGTGHKQNLMNDSGSAILFVLMMLVVLTIIGITSISTTNVEIKIAHNDKLHKQAFYAADGGTEIGREVIEQNVACPTGFPSNDLIIGTIKVIHRDIGYQVGSTSIPYDFRNITFQKDILFPATAVKPPRTMIDAYDASSSETVVGTGQQIAAGYSGGMGGVSSSSGGTAITYDLYSVHEGNLNSQYCIMINYKHIIGQEGVCNY